VIIITKSLLKKEKNGIISDYFVVPQMKEIETIWTNFDEILDVIEQSCNSNEMEFPRIGNFRSKNG